MKGVLRFGVFLFAFFPTLETSARAGGTYPGCAAPPSSFAKALTATPTTFSSILNSAAAGDVIYLNSGSYGAVSISNRKYAQFLTIKAASGQTPVLSSLAVTSSSHIVFSGLTVNANGVRSKSPGGILVNLASSNNVVFRKQHRRIRTSLGPSRGRRRQRMRLSSTPPLRPVTASTPRKTIAWPWTATRSRTSSTEFMLAAIRSERTDKTMWLRTRGYLLGFRDGWVIGGCVFLFRF